MDTRALETAVTFFGELRNEDLTSDKEEWTRRDGDLLGRMQWYAMQIRRKRYMMDLHFDPE